MSIGRNLTTVVLGTTTSRLLGFLRDVLIAATLGSGPIADAFVIAFRLPNLFRRLLAEGAFNAALVPLYTQKFRHDDTSAREFVGDLLTTVTVLLVGFTAMIELAMPEMVALLAPGFVADQAKLDLTVQLSRASFPFLGLASLAAILASLLHAVRHFAIAASATIALNVVLVGSLIAVQEQGLSGTSAGATWLCWAVSAAGLVQLVICCAGARWARIPVILRWPRLSPAVRELLWLSLPGIMVAGIAQVNGFVGSFVGSGSESVVSYLYYADRVYQLPLGIVGTAIGLVLLPNLNRLLIEGEDVQARDLQIWVLELSLFLILPAAVALFVAAHPIVAVLFERGAFNERATQETAAALAVYALGLPGYVIAKALQPAYFARRDMRTPFLIAVLGAIADVATAIALFSAWAQMGIALAAAISGWLNAIGLAVILSRRRQLIIDRGIIRRIALLLGCTVVMGIALHAGGALLAPMLAATQPLRVKGLALALLCAVGLFIYLGAAWVFGAFNIKAAIKAVAR
jgi:putative peptidoglycan lipid II flippase